MGGEKERQYIQERSWKDVMLPKQAREEGQQGTAISWSWALSKQNDIVFVTEAQRICERSEG